ncbi:MAG TPA: YxiJ family protein [Armatimonadota bacterium]|nr:YxiJ family protein [Armatimonadota bacterium]
MSEDVRRSATIEERIEELGTIYHQELLRPAPSDDCFKIEGDPDGPYGDLHPDLSTYKTYIASCCRGASKLVTRPTESLLEDRNWLSRTFFERWPLYADLEKLVTRDETPKLYRDLEVHEHARRLVLELIQAVLESRGELPPRWIPVPRLTKIDCSPARRSARLFRRVGQKLSMRNDSPRGARPKNWSKNFGQGVTGN